MELYGQIANWFIAQASLGQPQRSAAGRIQLASAQANISGKIALNWILQTRKLLDLPNRQLFDRHIYGDWIGSDI